MKPHASRNTREDHATSLARKECALDVIRREVAGEHEGPVSLGAHMGTDKSYVSRVLNGECPLSVPFILCLPRPVKKRICAAWGESLGLVVIEPETDERTALRRLVGSLLSLVDIPRTMAKAALPAAERKKEIA